MKAEILPAEKPGAIERAAALLQAGRLVVFPTDTLYGVGAQAFDDAAVTALFEVKERSLQKGIPILLADVHDLALVARAIPAAAERLMGQFWPGALTLIVPKQAGLPAQLSPNTNVAVRIPDHPVARAIIRAAGGAVAASSANLSGAPAARDAQQAARALHGRVAAVVDAGPAPAGVASTIVDCTVDPPQILRQGALSAEQLLAAAL